jgi:aspartyl-tRNA(Asn)/glutamyl-tRNA(Gln) amidotransferase subunit C
LHSDAFSAFRRMPGVAPESRSLGFSVVSQISRDEVAHLARLARLALTDDELDHYAGQLDAILTHVGQIQAVDVTGVEPTDNPLKAVNVTRPDRTAPCLTQQEALAGAPEALDGRFVVPQILGEPQ